MGSTAPKRLHRNIFRPAPRRSRRPMRRCWRPRSSTHGCSTLHIRARDCAGDNSSSCVEWASKHRPSNQLNLNICKELRSHQLAFILPVRYSFHRSAHKSTIEDRASLPGDVCHMLNYTDRLAMLMEDVVRRVPTLSFVNMADVLVFARSGLSTAEGAFATCHCLSLPPSEPGYYFWRDRTTHTLTRRSEWFVTKSPLVTVGGHDIKYMLSFTLPRFCDQSLDRSRKERFYPGAEAWTAKLDTVIHELYHIDPDLDGIRRIEREDGTFTANCHGHRFFEQVSEMVHTYLASKPDPAVYDFLRDDFTSLESHYGGIVGTTFRTFPSFPQRYVERLAEQMPCESDGEGVRVEPLRVAHQPTRYTQDDLHIRQFMKNTSRRLIRKGQYRAA